MDFKELIAGFASLAHKDADGFLSTLKDENGEQFTPEQQFDAVKKALQDRIRETGSGQLKRGQSEIKQEVLKAVKGFLPDLELEESVRAADAVKALFETMEAKGVKEVIKEIEVPKEVEITTAFLEANPKVQDYLKTQFRDKLNAKLEEADKAKVNYEQLAKKLVLSNRSAKIKNLLIAQADKLKVLLDVEGEEGSRQKRIDTLLLHPQFAASNWREDDQGNLYPVDENGNRAQTEDFHDAEMADLIKQVNPFGYSKKDASKGSPHTPTKGTSGAQAKIVFKDAADFVEKLNNAKTKEEKNAITEAWKSQAQA